MDYEWVFVDGLTECQAAPGIAALYPPPYRCWYTTPTTARVDAAQRMISSVIEREGPFDAVMGFSQVSQVVSATEHRLRGHHRELPWQRQLFYAIKLRTLPSRGCSKWRFLSARPCHSLKAWISASMREDTSA